SPYGNVPPALCHEPIVARPDDSTGRADRLAHSALQAPRLAGIHRERSIPRLRDEIRAVSCPMHATEALGKRRAFRIPNLTLNYPRPLRASDIPHTEAERECASELPSIR